LCETQYASLVFWHAMPLSIYSSTFSPFPRVSPVWISCFCLPDLFYQLCLATFRIHYNFDSTTFPCNIYIAYNLHVIFCMNKHHLLLHVGSITSKQWEGWFSTWFADLRQYNENMKASRPISKEVKWISFGGLVWVRCNIVFLIKCKPKWMGSLINRQSYIVRK
jgi:hypothetical protein